ncbi:MAG: four-carbon acid sugar kinase family protein [Chloroflexota bacterium]|nr:MAG: four-carbon acid sugar kinase family protein [Chloroflexota bacterium]
MHPIIAPITILADDLTGAADTGVQFALAGMTTVIAFGPPSEDASVVVIDTDSRSVSPRAAGLRVSRAIAASRGQVYKKIDSTLRGNVGAEVAAALRALGRPLAIVCPTFAATGRVTRGGVLHVDGVPVHLTPLARDPVHPINSPTIAAAIARQTTLPIANVSLADVRGGTDRLVRRLRGLIGISVVDAETDDDLAIVAAAIDALGDRALPVGSAGLAAALVALWRPSGGMNSRTADPRRPARTIIVARGSQNPVSRSQTAALAAQLGSGEIDGLVRGAVDVAVAALANGKPAIIVTPEDTRRSASAIARRLASVIGHVTRRAPVDGFILTGGDTARAVLIHLGARGLRLESEVAPGVPVGEVIGGALAGRTAITKAGGFGAPTALVDAWSYLARGGKA